MTLHTAPTSALSADFLAVLRRFLDTAFEGRFTEEDWHHALGGVHVWVDHPDGLISHGSVVRRTLISEAQTLETGYVESVATTAALRRRGHAATVMARINDLIRRQHDIGALSTGTPAFYATLGWELWRGPTHVQQGGRRERTPDDDGSIMILRTPRTPALDLDANIVCDWRPGEAW